MVSKIQSHHVHLQLLLPLHLVESWKANRASGCNFVVLCCCWEAWEGDQRQMAQSYYHGCLSWPSTLQTVSLNRMIFGNRALSSCSPCIYHRWHCAAAPEPRTRPGFSCVRSCLHFEIHGCHDHLGHYWKKIHHCCLAVFVGSLVNESTDNNLFYWIRKNYFQQFYNTD